MYKYQTPDHNLISSISKSEFEAKCIIYISDHLFHNREIDLCTKFVGYHCKNGFLSSI